MTSRPTRTHQRVPKARAAALLAVGLSLNPACKTNDHGTPDVIITVEGNRTIDTLSLVELDLIRSAYVRAVSSDAAWEPTCGYLGVYGWTGTAVDAATSMGGSSSNGDATGGATVESQGGSSGLSGDAMAGGGAQNAMLSAGTMSAAGAANAFVAAPGCEAAMQACVDAPPKQSADLLGVPHLEISSDQSVLETCTATVSQLDACLDDIVQAMIDNFGQTSCAAPVPVDSSLLAPTALSGCEQLVTVCGGLLALIP